MTGTLDSLPCTEQELSCYSGLYATRGCVTSPRTVEELRERFAEARRAGRKVTMRAGGHCFDSQALGDEVVISTLGMDSVEVLVSDRKVRVGPGATWGKILAELKPHGLVPTVTVTTENATAGGTLSGDCLSRFSPSWGKEGEQIESFDLLTTEGELLTCTRPPDGAPKETWTREQRTFLGAIGGLGFLGAVVSITYRVRSAADAGQPFGVKVLARRTDTVDELLAEYLMPAVGRALTQEPNAADPDKLDGIWSALDMRDDGSKSALLFTAAFTTETGGKRMDLHRPKLLLRVLVEWVMRVPILAKAMWWFYVHVLFRNPKQTFIDELEGYTFFMDGNARAKRIGKRFGFSMRNCQQTFVVPADPTTEEGRRKAEVDLLRWLNHAQGTFEAEHLAPTLTDVVFLPDDLPFALSASADSGGFACSYAFETSSSKRLKHVQSTFAKLADDLWRDFRGPVYLVKNVFASEETLRKMYGVHVDEFLELKRDLDPSWTLTSKFFEEKLGFKPQ